ncbi:MAG: hypothetical protein VB111_02995 [Clostridiaceae bacterium]|nr:hypothetical protein [Clostridiaceae bacterium]
MEIMIPAWYYAQQSADYTLRYPGEGYRGWTKADIPIDPAHTAVLVMHAWAIPPREDCPGIYRVCEYIPRSQEIIREYFPGFLDAVRKSGIRLIHIGSQTENSLPALPGYQRTLAKTPVEAGPAQIEADETLVKLRAFRSENVFYDGTNKEDVKRAGELRDFAIMPQENEDVACTSDQLFALCREHGISHLIYTGFCVNACLVMSPCGYIDMARHGVMCSVVRDLTTAVENAESCAVEGNKDYGLWAFALWGGFVFEKDTLMGTLLRPEDDKL